MVSVEEKPTLVYSVPEAGRLIGCARNKAYELAREGLIPVVRIKGRLVVPRERFHRWLNEEAGASSAGSL